MIFTPPVIPHYTILLDFFVYKNNSIPDILVKNSKQFICCVCLKRESIIDEQRSLETTSGLLGKIKEYKNVWNGSYFFNKLDVRQYKNDSTNPIIG